MTIDVSCPHCGRPGGVPKEKVNTRLICKKCTRPFHLNALGRAVPGDPPHASEGPHLSASKALERSEDRAMSVVRTVTMVAVVGLLVLVVGWGASAYLFQPPQDLNERATRAARAFAEDDLAALKAMASEGTADDLVQWFEAAHPALSKLREGAKATPPIVEVKSTNEDKASRTGTALALIYPPDVNERRGASATSAESASASSSPPVELSLAWVLDERGYWKLDGRETRKLRK